MTFDINTGLILILPEVEFLIEEVLPKSVGQSDESQIKVEEYV